ncbi:LuxR C-terminal-related transcriptional regulator, partial [Arthrobacter sp. GCM10027362]|uniref:helix-turn-helix transcriptional regulator n=1 Tax=Arthrobacter sp. GCM10027362 TaxID=3273379 RepID=UPI003643A875
LPAAARLRQDRVGRLRRLADAACAFAYALLQDGDGVRTHLAVSGDEARVPWQVQAAAGYYAGMARATVTSYPSAAAQLCGEGRRAADQGALAAALRFLSGAARLGGVDALPDLAAVAEQVQGPYARACASFTSGLPAEDSAALLAAARLAAGEGDAVFSREAARLALALAGGDTAMMRAAQQYIHADSAGFDFCVGRLGGGQALTARERDVAGLVAAGWSNADIARHFGVSVRTVEGHLHKLYAKLQPRRDPVPGDLAARRRDPEWMSSALR